MTRLSELSPRTKAVLAVSAAVDAALKAVAFKDLASRPSAEVRGPKWLWGLGIAVVNGFGVAPLTYLLLGRRSR